ncbi:hypothetical protein OAG68_01725 [bacterium]|nr:hypothetical protein [bacterium]
MKLKLAIATVVISVAMCTSSYGQLLDRMLGRGGGCGCEQATSCCDTPARGCGGSLFNLTINMPFSHCGGGCGGGGGGFFGGGSGLFGGGCGGGCGGSLLSSDCGGCGAVETGCDSGCGDSACGGCGGGLLSGMSGFRLFNRDRGCGCGAATDCGCNAAPAPMAAPSCGCESACGCGGGRLRGMFAGFGSRLGNRGGCGCEAPAADCGCNAAPMAAPACDTGCNTGCDNGCGGGGLLANLRGRLGNRGCGCRVQRAPRTVCFNVPNFGLLDRLRGRNAGCGCGNDGCNISGCGGCGGCGGQAMPMSQPTPMQGVAPTETMTPSVQPSVEPVEGAGARNFPRTPVVDPNAFIIRGGKYTASN